jgi:two-component system sensor histidine kinase UhpB
MRHAGAGSVRVRLRCSAQELVLTVQDDGRGMDPAAQPTRGLGLLGASERAAALGGRLQIESSSGAGLRLEMHLPLAGGAAP